jgi:hypothetical protein
MDLCGRAARIQVMSRTLPSAAVALLLLAFPALARAAGQPVLGYAGPSASLTSVDGSHHYLASLRGHITVVEDVSSAGTLTRAIPGSFAVPMVAFDGSLGGLSADGRTLILARTRTTFPETTTELLVLDADTLRAVRRVHLRGDFAFDAISPDGRWVYLIQYSYTSTFQYRVRALDSHSGRLLPHTIIDPHDRGEQMQGQPVTRLGSPDGRWAYTIYAGTSSPFIHALDTAGLRARCIDLPALPHSVNVFDVRLRLTDDRLSVTSGPRILSVLDTRSLRFVPVRPGRVHVSVSRRANATTTSIHLLAALVAILLASAATVIARRRPRAA